MADKLYFAYGSNINLEQMDYRCPDATVVGPVVLENYELLFRRGGFATIEPKKGERVHGLLWSITPECERSLDLYEGYPRFYDKQTVTVRDGLGRELPVMAYIMDERFREPMLSGSTPTLRTAPDRPSGGAAMTADTMMREEERYVQ